MRKIDLIRKGSDERRSLSQPEEIMNMDPADRDIMEPVQLEFHFHHFHRHIVDDQFLQFVGYELMILRRSDKDHPFESAGILPQIAPAITRFGASSGAAGIS